jgi:tRNA(Ile)-lysidine synthase
VSFSPEYLLARLFELETEENKPDRFVIALSGGLDSTVLTDALARTRQEHGRKLCAVHVDHHLHADSAAWSEHCCQLAGRRGIEFIAEDAEINATAGSGLEAAAREARYSALSKHIGPNDWLLSAHHRDDQAETLLLNLLRGSGPAGLAGIGVLNRFAQGWLARPLIDVSRAELEAYAADTGLDWVEDPANQDQGFDRNYLRHSVLPVLAKRWREAGARLARSAELAGESSQLLDELAQLDLAAIGERPARIDIGGLLSLSPARQRNLLRHALRRSGLPLPGAARLEAVTEQLVTAREDAQPLVSWPGAAVRRFRGMLYLLPDFLPPVPSEDMVLRVDEPLDLGPGMGTLSLSRPEAVGLSPDTVAQGLTVRYRAGGEALRPYRLGQTKKLKKLLQEQGIVPWMRDRVPLVYAGDRLVAVADLWIAEDAASPAGAAVVWSDRPSLY